MIGMWIKWLVLHTWDVFVLTYICQLVRSAIRPLAVPPDTRNYVHTLIFAVERCLCQIAMGAFYINGGVVGAFLIRTVLSLVWYYMVGRVDVNLCIFIENCVRRKINVGSMIMFTVVTFCGFKSVWLLIKYFCSKDYLGEYETHCDVVDNCINDLQVAPWLGALVEFTISFFIRFHSLYYEVHPTYQPLIYKIFFVNFITCFGMEYTGSYANPIMAYVLLYNCEGLNPTDFLVVYVAAPIIGSLLALLARFRLHPRNSSGNSPHNNSKLSLPELQLELQTILQPELQVAEPKVLRRGRIT